VRVDIGPKKDEKVAEPLRDPVPRRRIPVPEPPPERIEPEPVKEPEKV
jgi:hypothetical protein